jgi:hypothetical protein
MFAIPFRTRILPLMATDPQILKIQETAPISDNLIVMELSAHLVSAQRSVFS